MPFKPQTIITWLSIMVLCLVSFKAEAQTTFRDSIPEFKKMGEGPDVLLFVPCMSCRWNEWEEFMSRSTAKEKFTMYAVTLPGFGGTPVPELPMDSDETPWRQNAITALSNFIDHHELKNVTIVGHSFGSMVGLQTAALKQNMVKAFINIDGSIESDSWTPSDRVEQLEQAKTVSTQVADGFVKADDWAAFNGVGLPPGDSVERVVALRAIKMHGSFMATPKKVLIQYWRENPLIDLTADLMRLSIPVLDIQAITGEDQQKQRQDYLDFLSEIKSPKNIKTIFFFETRHYVMFQRPDLLEEVIGRFINNDKVEDFIPNQKTK